MMIRPEAKVVQFPSGEVSDIFRNDYFQNTFFFRLNQSPNFGLWIQLELTFIAIQTLYKFDYIFLVLLLVQLSEICYTSH